MLEIVSTIGVSILALLALTVVIPTLLSLGRTGPRERAFLLRQAGYWSAFTVGLGCWVTLGIYTMLSLPEFWRGAYWGGTTVLWLGYVPTLILTIRASNRRQAHLRLEDAALSA